MVAAPTELKQSSPYPMNLAVCTSQAAKELLGDRLGRTRYAGSTGWNWQVCSSAAPHRQVVSGACPTTWHSAHPSNLLSSAGSARQAIRAQPRHPVRACRTPYVHSKTRKTHAEARTFKPVLNIEQPTTPVIDCTVDLCLASLYSSCQAV